MFHHVPRLATLLLVLSATLSCLDDRSGTESRDLPPRSTPPDSGVIFSDETEAVGLDFVHFNGMSGEYYFSEIAGAGGALFDYDNDGDLDLYLVQGRMLGRGKSLDDALVPPKHPLPLTDRLYRNDLAATPESASTADGRSPSAGRLGFTDVTEESGLKAQGYGMGVAAGDYNQDGFVDLYVTNFGPNQLLRNNGDGTFTDTTQASGTGESRWSVSAAFFDMDRDGWLDLYIGNYVDFSLANHKRCLSETGLPDYCGPLSYNGEPDRLLRNNGDGTFSDITAAAGMAAEYGGALGVVSADFNGDGWSDVYVANDQLPNQLWIQESPGTFKNQALLAGCAVNGEGHPEASMGVDAADFDSDGDPDLFVVHLTRETNTLYLNDGRGHFRDATLETGLGVPSFPYTGFGTAYLDYDNDGHLDLLIVNGAVRTIEALARARDPFPLHQPNQLFHGSGGGRFREVTAEAGPAFARSEVSRGAAFGDVDNDGDTDALVMNNNGPARLLLNQVGHKRPWLGLRLVDREGVRDMLGARAVLQRSDGSTLWRRVRTDGSYASANDPRLLFGLGEAYGEAPGPAAGPADGSGPRRVTVDRVRVFWPDGEVEEWQDLAPGRYTTLRQGEGRQVD